MHITGRVIELSPIVEGTSKTGKDWQKMDVHIEEEGKYPNSLVISFMGDKINDVNNLAIGELVTIDVNTRVNEFNGKKYNNINGWRVEVKQSIKNESAPEAPLVDEPEDDLPF